MSNGQLTLKDIYDVVKELIEKGEDLSKYPVYLGNDDELNGAHTGWYVNVLDIDDTDENNQYIIDMINEDGCNVTYTKGKAILIS